MKGDLTKGPVMGSMLRFAVPMILGNLLQQCYNVADTLIVGRFLGADALAAVGLIFANLERAYQNGSDLGARRALLTASFRAGCAFTKSYVGYVHAVAHSLGGAYNVAHGYANAVILPMVLRAYGPAIHPQLAQLAPAAGLAGPGADSRTAALAFLDGLDGLKARCGIGNAIPELRPEDIPELARHADREANPLYPVPVLMDAGELEKIYRRLL